MIVNNFVFRELLILTLNTKSMKKLFTLLVLLSISFASMANQASSNPGPIIPVNPPPGNPGNPGNLNPNPLSLDPAIEVFYLNGALIITFNYDLGGADIVVSNTTTGEQWQDYVDGACVTMLDIVGEAGVYEINISTDYGVYTGSFIL